MAAIPTEPIGSIPRPRDLIERVARVDSEDPELTPHYENAIRNTIERFEVTGSPFRYNRYADGYLDVALRYAHVPVKQAVISPSALSLMYPAESIPGYSREQFIDDLL